MANQRTKPKKGTGKAETRSYKQQDKVTAKKAKQQDLEIPLGKENYIMMAIGFAVIILGYIIMAGDENIYNQWKISVSVILVMFGYLLEIYAIMKPPKK